MQTEIGRCLCQAWSYLARGIGHAKASCCLFGGCGPLRNLGKAHSERAKAGHLCGEAKLGGTRSRGITRADDWCWPGNGELRFGTCPWLPSGLGEGSTEEEWHLPAPPSPEKSPGPNLFIPHPEAKSVQLLPVRPWHLLPQCWS